MTYNIPSPARLLRAAVVLTAFGLACLAGLTGCQSPVGQAIGPVVAQVAQERIALAVLEKNPSAEAKLAAVSAALGALLTGQSGSEITEVAVRAFVAKRAQEWRLTAGEEALITTGLLAARDAFIKNTGAGIVALGDPRVQTWIGAIQDGIEGGIAEYHRRHP